MTFYGKLTKRNYESLAEMEHFETRERMRLDEPTEGEKALYAMPIEQFRALCDEAAKSDAEKQDRASCQTAMETWVELHPEFDNSTSPNNANGKVMAHYLRSRGIQWPTMHQLEDAYDSLRAAGLLRLKPDVLAQQHQNSIRKRADDIESQGGIRSYGQLSEEELEAMPLEEIRRRHTELSHLTPVHRGPVRVSLNHGR